MSYLYLHIPFCSSICYYCDFKRSIYNEEQVNQYLKVLNKQCERLEGVNLETIYIGGGTPSCLNIKQLEVLLNCLDRYRNSVKEYTIESNIESLDENKVNLFLQHGVNRISLGVQSMQDDLLIAMNRKHTRESVLSTLKNLNLWGMKNISVDLIYGLPNQTIEMWMEDLHLVCSNPYVSHISLYSLTIEENTTFHKLNYKVCENELEAQMYEAAIAICKQYTFKQYEIANFAKRGFESQHNQAYWRYEDFCGIGLGASGKEGNVRYTNQGNILEYCNQLNLREEIKLSKEDKMFEHIMMSLRMRKGLEIERFNKLYDVDLLTHYKSKIGQRIENKQLIIENGHLYVSEEAMFYLHDILIDFMD